jgi:precorrin-2 dehydrogenase/sirohydrochlorin ferrochelatase
VAVSTGGTSPLLARRIRKMLEEQFDTAYEAYVALLGELRPRVREQVVEPARRKALWEALLDSEVLELLRAGQTQAARQRAEQIVASYL